MSNADLLKRRLRLEWIDVSDLFIDPSAQREAVDRARVKKIVDNFDPHLFEALRVSQRGQRYSVNEGGHRLEVARELGIKWVPCVVTQDEGIAREGKTFLGINKGRKVVSGLDTHRVGVTMGDPDAVEIQAICDTVGVRIAKHQTAKTVRAMRPLHKALRRSNLQETLQVLADAWGMRDENSFDGNMVEGVSILLSAYPSRIDTKHLVYRLGAQPAKAVLKQALGKMEAINAAGGVACAHALLDIYNYRKKGDRLDIEDLLLWTSYQERTKRAAKNR